MRKPSLTNVVLSTATAVLAFALGAQMGGSGFAPAAYAQDQPVKTTTPPFNAAEQRRQTYVQLDDIVQRLDAIEKRLEKPLLVKVTEMPKEAGKR